MDRHAPLLATADPHLAAEVARLAAGAGVTPVLVEDASALLRCWHGPPLVLLGADLVEVVASVGPQRRSGVVLVSAGSVPPDLLRPALELGVGEVAELPGAGPWLTARLDDLQGAGTVEGRVIGVVGGAGGAGATTFAGALGQVGATRGSVLAIDADPLGPGLDRVLGMEHVDGVGWEVLGSSHGRLSARDLREGVPRTGPLGVLTWRRSGATLPEPDQVAEVVDAARRGHELVVLDVPRAGPQREALAMRCDLLVVVAPTTVAGVAATVRACAGLEDAGRAGLVLHGRDPDGCGAARATGLPVLASMTSQRGLDECLDLGLGPVRSRRGPLGRAATAVLDRVRLSSGRAA